MLDIWDCWAYLAKHIQTNEVTLMTLYTLPHKFTVHPDSEMDGCFILMCNGNFVHWAETLDDIFITYGNHLKHAKG